MIRNNLHEKLKAEIEVNSLNNILILYLIYLETYTLLIHNRGKTMKKTIIGIISIFMIVLLFTACQSQEPVQVDLEPPLTDEELSKPVPNFLNEDQQYLFKNKKCLSTFV